MVALKLAPRRVQLLSQAPLGAAAASAWAQGGVAAALGVGDSPEQHAADTVAAGAGLVDPAVALAVAREGPARIRELLDLGVPFDRDATGAFRLSLEAAHGQPRVARVKGDLAGRAIMDILVAAVRAATHVEVVENVALNSLLQAADGRVAGVVCDQAGRHPLFHGSDTVLATGGLGGLYRVTTNPGIAVGTALAAAYRVGGTLRDLEFVQFHPTALDIGRVPAPLATEALRGHGAVLVNTDGRAFMSAYHPAGDLAPRDVVARALQLEIGAGRGAALDARRAVGAAFPTEFPTVFAACMEAGIDPRLRPIPVAPAAHYHMGGIVTDAAGRTDVPGLWALGECASTGLHGANRLASNSLLEAVVFAHRAALALCADAGSPTVVSERLRPANPVPLLGTSTLAALRGAMGEDASLVRNAAGLQELLSRLQSWVTPMGEPNPLLVARLLVSAALARQESRGSHSRADFPLTQAMPCSTLQRLPH
jgi:L-aspartate oxidase